MLEFDLIDQCPLRGGAGNFGVVTQRAGALLGDYAGALFFPFERAAGVLHA